MDDVIDVEKISWLTLLGIRIKKLFIDFTSIKNWALGAIIFGFFKWDHFDSWPFVILVMAVLGLKEGVSYIQALRGSVQIVQENRTQGG